MWSALRLVCESDAAVRIIFMGEIVAEMAVSPDATMFPGVQTSTPYHTVQCALR